MAIMYMLHGFFGSGKSTWARNFAKEHPNTKIVSGDGFRTMFNGEYKYVVELDDVISLSMWYTAQKLLLAGYDIIIDVGNLSAERRAPWLTLPRKRQIAVIFPQKNKEWHIKNNSTKPHTVDWDYIWESEHKSYEPIIKNRFDEIIYVEEWEGN